MTKTDYTKEATKHTPEPWYVQPSDYPGGLLIKPIPGQVVAQCDQVPEMAANAHRIVATINACKGISTEALEQGIVAELLANLKTLLEQIDEDVPTDITTRHFANAYDEACATLAKATGRAA
jgi:hypothetical protein